MAILEMRWTNGQLDHPYVIDISLNLNLNLILNNYPHSGYLDMVTVGSVAGRYEHEYNPDDAP